MRWLVMPFLRYADFNGRSGRTEFWTFFGLSAAAFILTAVLTGLSAGISDIAQVPQPKTPVSNASPVPAIGYLLWWLTSIVPWFAVQARRFHDQGRSGWLCLIGISGYVAAGSGATPLAGLLFLTSFAFMALRGQPKTNRYGPPIGCDVNVDPAYSNLSEDGFLPPSLQLEPTIEEGLPKIERGADGLNYVAGRAFGSLVEAQRAARRIGGEGQSTPRFQVAANSGKGEFPVAKAGHQSEGWANAVSNKPPASQDCSVVMETLSSGLPEGINLTADGRYSCGGDTFSTCDQALSFLRRRTARSAPANSSAPVNVAKPPVSNKPLVSQNCSPLMETAASELPDGVKLTAEGRYSCGGYTFGTRDQALSFLRSRNARSDPAKPPVPVSFGKPSTETRPVKNLSQFGMNSTASKQAVAERWISSPATLTAGGIQFDAHLTYFGSPSRHQQHERHRSLIDPTLRVSNGRDPQGTTFSYWPNYSELTPEARRTYLEWLSTGRSDPNTPIGYVFIYFYGLERRLAKERSEADAPAILSELRRLLQTYGDNHSFKNYCSALMDMGELLFGSVEDAPTPTLDSRNGWELPIRLRVQLGKKVAAGQKLDANDALCWTLGHPMLYPRTPVTRCFGEFCELWKIRFAEQFPKGLTVREPKARLNFQYRAASAEFNATAAIDNLPDVGAISGPLSKFELLLGSCCDELDQLSRFLGRNPAEKDSAIAGALLPEPLRESDGQSTFGQFARFLGTASERTGFVKVAIPEVMAQLGFADALKADERRALHLKRLPELFDAAGFGFEPDKRFGPAPSLSEDLNLCVFPAERGGAVNANRPEYVAARTMAEIAALAARADELVVDAEIESITADLTSFPEISDLDRYRLRAHVLALLANPSKLKAATKRLCELPECQRHAALTSAVRAVLADQRITPSEVRFLEGLYKALGLPQDEVYSRLHSGEVAAKPASKAALPSTQGVDRKAVGAEIDHEKLARLKEETSAVSSMLASIFKEEGTPAKRADEKPSVQAEFTGLDSAHSSLLVSLTEAPIESDAFEAICRDHKLLPSGAIETINDWAFDAVDDYAIEEGELICIQEHLVGPIRAMRKAK